MKRNSWNLDKRMIFSINCEEIPIPTVHLHRQENTSTRTLTCSRNLSGAKNSSLLLFNYKDYLILNRLPFKDSSTQVLGGPPPKVVIFFLVMNLIYLLLEGTI